MNAEKILSIKDVCELINRDRRTLWCWIRDGKFPAGIKMGNRTIGWKQSTYNQWLESLQA